jgi:hypothetical protein
MKFIHIFINEFKTKWSTKLLVGIFALVISSLFASNLILKHEYDLVKNKPLNRFSEFQEIGNQPFKHIVIANGRTVDNIYFENSNRYALLIAEKEDVSKWAQNIFIKNDTLFVAFKHADTNKMNSYPSSIKPFLYILAPNIESIQLANTEIFINDFQQKSLNINLLDNSRCTMGSAKPIDSCKVTLSDYSDFSVDLPIDLQSININSVEINMEKNSSLHLKKAKIEQLILNTKDDNTVELSSTTLMNLMKK